LPYHLGALHDPLVATPLEVKGSSLEATAVRPHGKVTVPHGMPNCVEALGKLLMEDFFPRQYARQAHMGTTHTGPVGK